MNSDNLKNMIPRSKVIEVTQAILKSNKVPDATINKLVLEIMNIKTLESTLKTQVEVDSRVRTNRETKKSSPSGTDSSDVEYVWGFIADEMK